MPETLVYGEDLAKPGGVFGVTKGLRDEFGDRVFDTPISESAIIGSAVGAAMMGRRPVIEIMWVDFSLVALDQIVNQAANVRYVSNSRLRAPMTIRTQQGVMPGACAQHAQNLEAIFAHVPGLLVGMPSTPQDEYDMLLAAIRCDDPVLIIENRGLYHGKKAPVETQRAEGIGGARVLQEGDAATVVTWGAISHQVTQAAAGAAAQGFDVEVIDLRWLVPFDEDTVVNSVEKTGKLLVVHEANVRGGFGAEVAARVAGRALYALDAPIARLGLADSRMPAAPHLQAAVVPGIDDITREILNLVRL
jgi:pyruvate/2-oxoglutarate/acetoin dehydrogenase E1 component